MADLLKKFLLILFFALFPLVNVEAAQDDAIYTYVFHLYFDQGTLVKDRDFETPFELIAQEFQYSKVMADSYHGEIWSVTNKKLASFLLVPPAGGKGKLSPMAPYFDNAKIANFYSPQNQKLLTIDLAPFGPVCNEDKQCNADTGETYLNCPSDCPAPVSPSVSPVPMPKSEGRFPIKWLEVVLVLAVAVVIVLLWLRKKRKIYTDNVPPQI